MVDDLPPQRVRAAQYLRMSTEHQRYSLENQATAIAVYAALHKFEVVKTYSDAGKSGLTLQGRDGLKNLLADVVSNTAEFDTVLVLDVSRWGRFQDPDQAAHYEFLCREAGKPVRYCAEQFENDGALVSSIMKHLKRVMAGEYSREMSERIKYAKRRMVLRGFKQSSTTTYGFNRVVVDGVTGVDKYVLKRGEIKAVKGDKVVLRLGAAEEIATVKLIFRLFTRGKLTARQIADQLERQGRPRHNQRPWTKDKVRVILANPIYTGLYVYGRTESNLRGGSDATPLNSWLKVKVLPPIVGQAMFEKARDLLRLGGKPRISDDEMIQRLFDYAAKGGIVTRRAINQASGLPKASTYASRFGSMMAVYDKIGHRPRDGHHVKPLSASFTDEQIIAELREIYASYGYISGALIDNRATCPGKSAIEHRFGSLITAYAMAGYSVERDDICRAAAHHRNRGRYWSTMPRSENLLPKNLTSVCPEAKWTDEFLLDRLRAIFDRCGEVNGSLINFDPDTPPVNAYFRRFGTLTKAYAAAGLPSTLSDIMKTAHKARPRLLVRDEGGRVVRWGPRWSPTCDAMKG